MLPDGGGEECWLAKGIAGVQYNAFYMHRALVSPVPPPDAEP
jgi:vacuolar protein sorting-associated protein 35